MKIGLFDSGVGGLTCLTPLLKTFPEDQFVYLGDTARLPYGTKSKETIQNYVRQNVQFLEAQGVDVVISACHSASTVLVGKKEFEGVPTYEVITPACHSVNSSALRVGLMATAATVASGSYTSSFAKSHPNLALTSEACPLLVALVECGWVDDPVTRTVLKRYLAPLLAKSPEAIVLGCTHFPVLKSLIAETVPSNIRLIDPGEALCELLKDQWKDKKPTPKKEGLDDPLTFFLTDCSPQFIELAQKLLPPRLANIRPQLCSLQK